MGETQYEIRDRLNDLRDHFRKRLKEDALIVILSAQNVKDLLDFMDSFLDD